MNFFLTTYIYPIKAPHVLSETLNFTLDNPRTEEEIQLIRDYLEASYNSSEGTYGNYHFLRLPVEKVEGFMSIQQSLEGFEEKFSKQDEYVNEFFQENKTDELFLLISKMWIIARFDDDGELERMKKFANEQRELGNKGIFLLEDNHPIVDNSKKLQNYSHLISLLINNDFEEYMGGSFIQYHHVEEFEYREIDKHVIGNIFSFCLMAGRHPSDDPSLWRHSFPFIAEKLFYTATALETILKDEFLQDKILYVANLLKVSSEDIKDDRLSLVTLVSVLELLLTHSPDYNRFNIEDSISKQFKLKASILVYLNDPNKDLNWIKKRLTVIYNQRSNIAHGNFSQYDKYVKGLSKKDGQEEYFSDLIVDLLSFIRAIIKEYIKDSDFVEFLKEN